MTSCDAVFFSRFKSLCLSIEELLLCDVKDDDDDVTEDDLSVFLLDDVDNDLVSCVRDVCGPLLRSFLAEEEVRLSLRLSLACVLLTSDLLDDDDDVIRESFVLQLCSLLLVAVKSLPSNSLSLLLLLVFV